MAEPDPTPRDLVGALLHRLASPLGAIRNYAHVLPEDPDGLRASLLEAIEALAGRLDEGRAWVRARKTLADPVPSGGVDLDALIREVAAAQQGALASEAGASPRVQAPVAAVQWILDAVLTNADRIRAPVSENGQVEVAVDLAASASAELRRPGALDLFAAGDAAPDSARIQLAVATALARELDGDIRVREPSAGGLTLHLRLPSVGADVPSPDEAS